MDQIELVNFEFETIVGILPQEREQTQPISFEISLGLDLEKAGTVESLTDSVNYARVQDVVMFLTREGRWHLIEALGLAICRTLLVEPTKEEMQARILEVDVQIRKPRILAPVSVPGVRIKRVSEWFQADVESQGPGVVLLPLAHTLNTWVWRVQLAPGAKWVIPENMATMVLAGEVEAELETYGNGATVVPKRGTRPVKAIDASVLLLVGNNAT